MQMSIHVHMNIQNSQFLFIFKLIMTFKKEDLQEEHIYDHLTVLQMEEVKIGNKVTSNQYAEIILGHLVLNRLIQAKFCYLRAIEQLEGDTELIKQIWEFGYHIYMKEHTAALKVCKNTLLTCHSLQHYVIEIRNRLSAKLLQLVARTYTTISLKKFVEMMCLMNEGGSKRVQNTSFLKTLTDLYNPRYGHDASDSNKTNSIVKSLWQMNLENLASIVKSSVFFDVMESSTSNSTSGTGSNSNN
ncbi:CSN8_PSD8_EIF3K domain-containing protein [Meloidogyne graminicola]|uniref:CSN8_PSD8_EIF3K domain-containing protein n=1 Tax=Meloidogyne graminicola TaxID=189291 RepID=A0A8S9ZXG6_9BILA|nr:CSN8_PSD8_EIF3K domain-containing protein [Meloidogyne graminicola]